MTLKTYARKWLTVLLAVAVLLPALAVYLPVTAEEVTLTQNYDSLELGTALGLKTPANAVVSSDVVHPIGAEGKSLKVAMTTSAGTGREQFALLNSKGEPMQVEVGKIYTISMWVYVRGNNTVPLNYWVCSSSTPAALTDKSNAEYDLGVGNVATPGYTWVEVTFTMNKAVANGPYLIFGLTTSDANGTPRTAFIDDVSVTEYVPTGVATRAQDYDSLANGANLGLKTPANASVSDAYDHTGTAAGGQSLKVAMTTNTGTGREQFALLNSHGEPMQVQVGKTYNISMWVYISGNSDVPLNYWLCSSPTVAALSSKSNAEYDLAANSVSTPTNRWVQVTFTTAPIANGPYLIFGITAADAHRYNRTVYVDDITVTDTEALVNEQDYEEMATGTSVVLNGEGTVSAERNHTADGGRSAKVLMDTRAGLSRAQLVLLNSHEEPLQVEMGKAYDITMWVYMEDSASTVALNYWVCSSPSATALSDKTNAEYDMQAERKSVATGSWQQIKITVDNVKNGPYLVLGITAWDADTNNRYIYIDDVAVTEYVPFSYGIQDYESYEAMDHSASGGVINGNGSGREVSTEQNHTPGGQKSIKLNVNNSYTGSYARTVLPLDGADYLVKRGDCYTVSFWLYSAEEREVTWFVGSTVSATNLYVAKNDAEQQGMVTLPAAQWTQVSVNVNVAGTTSPNPVYLTVGVLFAGCLTDPAPIYLDDVELVVPDDLITVTFHAEGGSQVATRRVFADMPMGYLASSTRAGYMFSGWYNADGSMFYTENTVLPAGTTAVELYAKWVKGPDTAQSLTTGFEESDYTAVPYTNDDPATAVLQSNMTATATWMKDAGFNAETGDGAMRLVNDPFVQESATAYHAFALMNADGTPFVVKGGAKYRITYSYRGSEQEGGHSYVSAFVSSDVAFTGVGTGDQQLTRGTIHGNQMDWQHVDECFLAEGDGYVYFTFCARNSTSEASSKGHAVYIDNVTVEVLDDAYSVVTFRCSGTVIHRVGEIGSPLRYPGFSVASGKELEGWYTDTAYTQRFTADVYPAQDTILYGRIVSGDYDTDIVYVEDSLTLDFEEDSLPTFYSAKNHMTYGNDYIDFVTGDADEARSGDSYIRLNPIMFDYSPSYFMLYNPDAPHDLLYLKPNSSYRVSFYVKVEDDFVPFDAMLCLGDPSGIGQSIQDTYIVSANVVAGEWVQAETIVVTGDEPTVLSLRPPLSSSTNLTTLVQLDDFSILKLYDVTVTFDTNGGDPVAPVVTSLASTIEPPIAPYRMGYEFRGWYTDKELKNAFDFATPIMEDMTLYARWRQVTADEDEEGTTGGTDPSGNAGTDTPSAPVDTPVTEPMMDTGDRPTFNPAATPEVPADEPTEQPTPEGTFSVQMLLIIIAIVVVLVGGGALTVLLLRKKKKTNEEEG